MIPVTKPYLPSRKKYFQYVRDIYERQWLTNNGPLVKEFEYRLRQRLGLEHLLYVSNGTIALQLAIKALSLHGEIITTPFSYVATTSSIVWEGCTPVFVDIDAETLNIDPTRIEQAISSKTTAILATHCFGNACDIDAIDAIAKRHNLKVIYDAAHCFGTLYKGRSIFEHGDISTSSLHATKLMHSVEGGLVVTNSVDVFDRVGFMRNFGHDGPEKFNGVGINGKNSEFHAAMGLCVLDDIDVILARRAEQCLYYEDLLSGLNVRRIRIQKDTSFNYAYFPIIFDSEKRALTAKTALEKNNIFPRRYFYPSLNQLDYVPKSELSVSSTVSKSILCLPLYHDLTKEEQQLIADILLNVQRNG